MVTDQARPSAWNKFPTPDNPDTKYKFNSLFLGFSQASLNIERKTYNFLEWLGDLGGLFDSLVFIGQAFLPVISFTSRSGILTTFFEEKSQKNEQREQRYKRKPRSKKVRFIERILMRFNETVRIKK